MDDNLYDASMLVTTGNIKATDVVPEIDIYEFYHPGIKMGLQRSPLRLEIKSASFSLHERGGKLEWKDHGKGGNGGDVFDFVQEFYKVKKRIILEGFIQINNTIFQDMALNNRERIQTTLFTDGDIEAAKAQRGRKGPVKINVTDRGWTDWAIGYWIERYNIAPQILESYHCGHASEVWVTIPGRPTFLWGISTPENPIFYFYFPRTDHIKCYRPFARNIKDKWIMNCSNDTDIQGYDQIDIKHRRPKLIIFTKAMKEVMFYRSFHLDSLAIHGEGHHFNSDFIRHIRKYSTWQFSLYDNDSPGKVAAIKLYRSTGIEPFKIQGAKNITDLWEQSPQALFKYVDQLKTNFDLWT